MGVSVQPRRPARYFGLFAQGGRRLGQRSPCVLAAASLQVRRLDAEAQAATNKAAYIWRGVRAVFDEMTVDARMQILHAQLGKNPNSASSRNWLRMYEWCLLHYKVLCVCFRSLCPGRWFGDNNRTEARGVSGLTKCLIAGYVSPSALGSPTRVDSTSFLFRARPVFGAGEGRGVARRRCDATTAWLLRPCTDRPGAPVRERRARRAQGFRVVASDSPGAPAAAGVLVLGPAAPAVEEVVALASFEVGPVAPAAGNTPTAPTPSSVPGEDRAGPPSPSPEAFCEVEADNAPGIGHGAAARPARCRTRVFYFARPPAVEILQRALQQACRAMASTPIEQWVSMRSHLLGDRPGSRPATSRWATLRCKGTIYRWVAADRVASSAMAQPGGQAAPPLPNDTAQPMALAAPPVLADVAQTRGPVAPAELAVPAGPFWQLAPAVSAGPAGSVLPPFVTIGLSRYLSQAACQLVTSFMQLPRMGLQDLAEHLVKLRHQLLRLRLAPCRRRGLGLHSARWTCMCLLLLRQGQVWSYALTANPSADCVGELARVSPLKLHCSRRWHVRCPVGNGRLCRSVYSSRLWGTGDRSSCLACIAHVMLLANIVWMPMGWAPASSTPI